MQNDSSVRKQGAPTEALHSDTDAATSCSRPTPLLPTASNDPCDFDCQPTKACASSSHRVHMPSSHSMVGPDELYPIPRDPSQAVDAINELLAKRRVRARASRCAPIPPLAPIAIDPATHRRGHVRGVSARSTFLPVLAKLLGFIGYLFRPRPRQRPAGAPSEHRWAHEDALSPRSRSGVRPVAKLPLLPPASGVQRNIP